MKNQLYTIKLTMEEIEHISKLLIRNVRTRRSNSPVKGKLLKLNDKFMRSTLPLKFQEEQKERDERL